MKKAEDRNYRRSTPFVFPYNLGVKENFRQVFNWRESFNVIGDGLSWPVRDACDQYTLTREQLEQKREKRQRTIPYEVIRSYSGSFFTCRHGCKTCICIPCTDESRIPVESGDHVLVTRWEKYWFYGERIIKSSKNDENGQKTKQRPSRRPRGWFPRQCVDESFRIEDIWCGKLVTDSDTVRNHFSKFCNEGYDDDEHDRPNESNSTTETQDPSNLSVSTSSSTSSEASGKIRKRKSTKKE